MENLFDFLENFGLSLIGLAFYALWAAKDYLFNFDWSKFWNHNKVFWLWAALVQILYSIVMAFYPELESTFAVRIIDATKALLQVDWDINEELTKTLVYLTGTWQLSRFAKRAAKKPTES